MTTSNKSDPARSIDMEHTIDANAESREPARVAFKGLSKKDVAGCRLGVSWSHADGTTTCLPLGRDLKPVERDGKVTLECPRDDLLALLSDSHKKEPDDKVYLVLLSKEIGYPVACKDRTPVDTQALKPLAILASGARSPKAKPGKGANKPGDPIWVALFSKQKVSVDIAREAGLQGPDLHAVIHPGSMATVTLDPKAPRNGGKVEIDAGHVSRGWNTWSYAVHRSDEEGVIHGKLHIFKILHVWVVLAAISAVLLGLASARHVAAAFLDVPAPEMIQLQAGDTKRPCTQAKYPAKAHLRYDSHPTPAAAPGHLLMELERGPRDEGCPGGEYFKITSNRNVPPATYGFEFRAGYWPLLMIDKAATLKVRIGKPIVLAPQPQNLCIAPGPNRTETTVNLAANGQIDPKDGSGNKLKIAGRIVEVQTPLEVRLDDKQPPNAIAAVPAHHTGELFFAYTFEAGGYTTPPIKVTINDPRQCGAPGPSTQPPGGSPVGPIAQQPQPGGPSAPKPGGSPPAPKPGVAPRPPKPDVASLPTKKPMRHAIGNRIVPTRGGIILPLEGIGYQRAPGTELPRIGIVTPPQHMQAAVAGQFIVLTMKADREAQSDRRDTLTYAAELPGGVQHFRLAIVYRQMCMSSRPQENMIHFPKGNYYFPATAGQPQRHRDGLRTLSEAELDPQLVDAKAQRVQALQPFCLQVREQTLGSLEGHIVERQTLTPERLARIRREMEQDTLTGKHRLPDVLRYINFEEARRIADLKSSIEKPIKQYWIPKANEWVIGLIAAVELAGVLPPPTGDILRNSYFGNVHEWVDAQPTPINRTLRLGLGPSSTEPDRWHDRVSTDSVTSPIGVRYAREP
ncbi:MAG: hypothetical protein ACREC6_02545 [Hyphomicrobiaceae bacterium]